MLGIDQSGESCFRRFVPFTGSRFAAGILRRSDNFKIRRFQLAIQFLPDRQIEAAASPRGPGRDQDLLAAKLGKTHQPSLAVRNREVRRHARFEEAAANCRDFAKAPNPICLIDNHRLPNHPGESRNIEVIAPRHVFFDRDTHIRTAGALRFQLKTVDSVKVDLMNPE